MKLGAYILYHNEEQLLSGCIERILPYVEELLLVNHQSTDKSKEIALSFNNDKIKHLDIEYREPVDMGKVRTECYRNMSSEWVLAVDADEWYPRESMATIRDFVENPGEAISARVKYINLAWRKGYAQTNFNHFPDRLYIKECVEEVRGILPDDMTFVKSEFLLAPNKRKGSIGVLEYDNEDDRSFIHPKQPIINATYYHLARTRGYNFEFNKWLKYNKNLHPEYSENQAIQSTRINQWVTGLYNIEPIEVNFAMPPIKNPKVSVVITNYNYGQFVGKAIESCINQTVNPHEIIVVDDCSTDNSREIIEKYNVKKLYQPENKGVVQCRNWGINETTGDFFLLLDADDYISPDYLEKVLKKQAETNSDITYTDINIFGDINYKHVYDDFTIERLKQNQNIPSVCALVKRQMFNISGGFREDTIYEDYEWWLRLCIKHNAVVAQVHEPLFNYNRKKGGRCEENDKRQAEGFAQLNREYGKTL